jgi:hypothetical protein
VQTRHNGKSYGDVALYIGPPQKEDERFIRPDKPGRFSRSFPIKDGKPMNKKIRIGTGTPAADPEYVRWHKKYPRFPGVETCLVLLRSSNVRGVWIDQICFELQEHAAETANELIAAFYREENTWVQLQLIMIMSETGLPVFQPLLIELLRFKDENLRCWAVYGLEKLGTKEARTALWEFSGDSGRQDHHVSSN